MPLNIVPNPGQTLANTRDDIRNNFSVIRNAFIVDHVDYNTAGEGKHNKVTFPVQGGAPGFAAGELGIFNALFNTGTAPTNANELCVQRAAGTSYPFTAAIPNGTAGYAYLPSGIVIQWGINAGSPFTANFSRPFTTVFNAQVSVFNHTTAVNTHTAVITALTNSQITVSSSYNGDKFWMAIGLGSGI